MAENIGNNVEIAEIDNANTTRQGSKILAVVKDYIYIPIVLVVGFLLFGRVLMYGVIPSGSMEPTFATGSCYIGTHLAYGDISDVKRGDIIVFEQRSVSREDLVKRVIGLPGDTIYIDGDVYINGELLDESAYLPDGTFTNHGRFDTIEVPEGCLFVMGDNRGNSHDSRYWATDSFVHYENIVGKVWTGFRIPFWNAIAK